MKNKDSFPLWRQSMALLLANLFVILTVQAQQSTWVAGATNATLWSKNGNWSPLGAIPNTNSAIAIFGPVSKPPLVDVDMNFNAGEVRFVTNAPAYTITVDAGQSLSLHGAGITNQSANTQTFVNNGILQINSTGTAGTNVSITNNLTLRFTDSSKAGSAIITTNTGGSTLFLGASSGDQAQFITNAGGLVDISALITAGTTAGSIAGVGTYNLGSKEFTVGSNSLSTIVSGLIEGTGGSLVKVGTGTLELDGDNTYTGGTTINDGTLVVGTLIAADQPISTALGTGNVFLDPGTLRTTSASTGVPLIINVGGNYTQAAGGTLVLGIGGTQGEQYDHVQVKGSATLGGTLVVNSLGGFHPATWNAL